MDPYQDKVAVITGAGSGIGRALAENLAARGAVVVLADKNGKAVEEAAARIRKKGGKAQARELDVTDREAVKQVIEQAWREHGRLDYLFNNAGIAVGGEARDFEYEDWKEVLDVNLYGVIHGVLAAYPLMLSQGFGHIVNTSSLSGLFPHPGEISYTASKYAIVGLSHVLRVEAADLGVKVSVVCPGKIETAIYHTSKVIGYDREKALAMWPKGITPEECAEEILKGVARNQATIPITRLAKFLWFLHRLSPNLGLWLAQRWGMKARAARLEGETNDHKQ